MVQGFVLYTMQIPPAVPCQNHITDPSRVINGRNMVAGTTIPNDASILWEISSSHLCFEGERVCLGVLCMGLPKQAACFPTFMGMCKCCIGRTIFVGIIYNMYIYVTLTYIVTAPLKQLKHQSCQIISLKKHVVKTCPEIYAPLIPLVCCCAGLRRFLVHAALWRWQPKATCNVQQQSPCCSFVGLQTNRVEKRPES